jgi:hypothetical protein
MKKRYAITLVHHRDERIVYHGEIHHSDISKFTATCMERGLLLTNYYEIDPDCQPKIVTLGKGDGHEPELE